MTQPIQDTSPSATTWILPATLAKAIAESQDAPIWETELASILARDWCEEWGGWPNDTSERMAQIWAFRPAARKLMTAIKRVAKSDRQAFARACANDR